MKLLAALLILFPIVALSAEKSPVGLWKTIDDNTHTSRALVRISEQSGSYTAKIEKTLDTQDSPNAICEKCTDSRKNQPIIGLTIVQGLQKKGEVYKGGEILDPENGRIYQCKMKLSEDGNQLEVRGFIGISLLGRSQIWLRQD